MLDELKKSINYIVYERTTSPFWGSFIFSWLICNWKIVFTVFVVSETKLPINKIDYIAQNFINWKPLIFYPFCSTIILVAVFPLLGNAAYWMTIIYAKWRLDKKNEVDKKQLLSIEQSIAIRVSNRAIEENYNKLIDDKDTEIKTLKIENSELQNRLKEPTQVMIDRLAQNTKNAEIEEWKKDYDEFQGSSRFGDFEKILSDVNTNVSMDYYSTQKDSIIYFQSLDLIKLNAHGAAYELTQKGLYFSRLYNKQKFEKS